MSRPKDEQPPFDELLDGLADEFVTAWLAESNPRIEDYLQKLPPESVEVGLRELLCLELELRLRVSGERIGVDSYVSRFPLHRSLIDAIFNELDTAGGGDSLESTGDERRPSVSGEDSAYVPRHAGQLGVERVIGKGSVRPSVSRNRMTKDIEQGGDNRRDHNAGALQVCCPHCHHRIEIVDNASFTEIPCPTCGSSFSLIDETLGHSTELTKLGHFTLLEELGVGASGTVWKARDNKLDRIVAVKIPRKSALSASETDFFLREARAAAQLRHPNIVAVHEVGRADGQAYIVSDFVEGRTLANSLAKQRSTPRVAAELCAQLADALQHAHEAGIVHRDLKPTNILLDLNDNPCIVDFGLAKREAGEVTMTIQGKMLGTPAYMSPEQARGEAHQATAKSDIYSLGVVLFELLTGERPFRGSTRMVLHQVVHDAAPSPRRLNHQVPRDLDNICLKCLEREPRLRYSSARELAEDLRNFLEGNSVRARPVGAIGRFHRWLRRQPRSLALISGGYATCLSTALIAWASSGIVFVALGFHPVDRPWRAVCELCVIIGLLYLPMLVSGVLSMNGRVLGLWCGGALALTTSASTMATVCGLDKLLLELESVQAAGARPYSQFQLFSLLALLSVAGLTLYVAAIIVHYHDQNLPPHQATQGRATVD